MKRLNPATQQLFKFGDLRADGRYFYAYTNRLKKDGYFIEMWLTAESFALQKKTKRQNYEADAIKVLERNRQYYEQNKSEILSHKKQYKIENRARYTALGRLRETKKTHRTPPWLTVEQQQQIQKIYQDACKKTKANGIEYHVDHIVPLCGKNVSGLHVPWNLQILTAADNLKKHNKFTVD